MGKYNKFWVALGGALAALLVVVDGGITAKEWIQVAIAALTAAGVYQIPNR